MGLRAVILDWAGTTVDYGCQAPVNVLQRLFEEERVPISAFEARHAMGRLKKDQIRDILALPRVAEAWASRHGKAPGEEDVSRLFARFGPMQLDTVAVYSGVIPGVREAVARMRGRGLKIGSTTGYTRPMLNAVMGRAAAEGYAPDASVTPEEVGAGRPLPFMCYQNAILLQVYPLESCVKIGDTPADMQEGRNAGMWTIGVTLTGNEVGLGKAAVDSLSPDELAVRLSRARERLLAAGAHAVMESVAEVDAVLDDLERWQRNGMGPGK
jgi:phosphonoacetaldehyde hydrolase